MRVQSVHTILELQNALTPLHRSGATMGLVPTMGALHKGHASLIERCSAQNDITVVSVFINPMQFSDANDLNTYPRTMDEDIRVCEDAGADFVFVPAPAEMYPSGFSTFVDMTGPTERLCGVTNPAHFRGVLTVVSKLLNIVQPNTAYFGEKDAQQLFVIKKMVRDMNMPVKIVGCPSVRDTDMVAVSSRNKRLSSSERKAAQCLYRALSKASSMLTGAKCVDVKCLRREMTGIIEAEALAVLDYAEILDRDTMGSVSSSTRNVILAVAASFGGTRLIDNMICEVTEYE